MTVHLERKKAVISDEDKQLYQRLSYDIVPEEDNKLSIYELNAILNEFAKRSNGEFNYCITDNGIVDESGNVTFGKVLFGNTEMIKQQID